MKLTTDCICTKLSGFTVVSNSLLKSATERILLNTVHVGEKIISCI